MNTTRELEITRAFLKMIILEKGGIKICKPNDVKRDIIKAGQNSGIPKEEVLEFAKKLYQEMFSDMMVGLEK